MRVLGSAAAVVFVALLAWNLLTDRTAQVRAGAGLPAPRSCHVRGHRLDVLPDPRCTPGRINPHATQATVHPTICARGSAASVRPPSSAALPAVTYPGVSRHSYHVNPKDRVEDRIDALICRGRISLAAAQAAIRTNWINALNGAR